jgi:hypothetical protein
MKNNRAQIRLNEKDQAAYQRGLAYLQERNPHLTTSESDVLRYALHVAFGDNLLCPYCESEMVEHTDDEGGTLGIWHCPECAEGNGPVVIET